MASFYDAGVYVGAALHLVNGTLPYRDFTLVEPPGIVLLLSPVALLSHLVGDHGTLIAARTMSAVATGVNVGLLAWLVRSRGRIAMVIAGLGLASLPVASFVDTSVKLESYCVLLSLLSAAVAFGRSDPLEPLSRRRAIISGVLAGGAVLVKFVAFIPLVALLLVITRQSRRRALEFVSAAAVTFAAVCAPFFLSSPRNFLSQVFFDQIIRQGNQSQSVDAIVRLKMLTGFGYSEYQPSSGVTVAIVVAIGIVLVAATLRRSRTTPIDDVLTLSGVLLALGLMIPSHASNYYFYESAPFLVGAVVVSVARLAPTTAARRAWSSVTAFTRRFVRVAIAVAAVGLSFGAVLWSTTVDQADAWAFGVRTSIPDVLDRQIPAGACVIYSQIYDAESANRFVASASGCPPVTDTFGMWLAWGERWSDPPAGFARQWRSYLSRASYAVFSYGSSSNVPWTPDLRRWFSRHYTLAHTDLGFQVYRRNAGPTGA